MTEFVLPETKYARSGDLNIAYQIVGEGPIDILIVPGAISHLELVYELPGCINFINALALRAYHPIRQTRPRPFRSRVRRAVIGGTHG